MQPSDEAAYNPTSQSLSQACYIITLRVVVLGDRDCDKTVSIHCSLAESQARYDTVFIVASAISSLWQNESRVESFEEGKGGCLEQNECLSLGNENVGDN